MTKKRFCDVCERQFERTLWNSDKRPASEKRSITAKKPLRRRFIRWLLGPYYKYREWGKGSNGRASMIKFDICSSCRREIRKEVIYES